MIMSIARDYIRPECLEEYMPLISRLIAETRKEPGNVQYTLFRDKEQDGSFALLEFWRDQESLNRHFESAHFKSLVPQIQKLQAKPSVVNLYEEALKEENYG